MAFETNAVRVCPQNKPFGTHRYNRSVLYKYAFLYGSEEKANGLLRLIDMEKENELQCPEKVLAETLKNYESDDIYRGLIDELHSFIKNNIDIDKVDYVSGGERRDWFFSLIIAKLINKPHISIYKNLTSVITIDGNLKDNRFKREKVLHIADLITEASSYERAWIPAIKNNGGRLSGALLL